MDMLMLTRTYLARSLSVCAAVVLVGSVTACAGGESTEEPGSRPETIASSSADGGSADGFCASVDGIGDDLALLELTQTADPAQFPDRVSRAAKRFAGIEPPQQIATAWKHVNDFLVLTDEALRGVEVETEEDLKKALRLEGEEAFSMVLLLPGQAEAVGVYVQDACQVDLGITPPAIKDVCAAVDIMHLQSVFNGAVPEGNSRSWGKGTVECGWDDGKGHEVGVVVMPAATMHSDLLKDKSPLESVKLDGATINVYDGALGPLRAAAGRTAATVVGDIGVLVSVRSGDAQAETQKAIALAGLLAVDVG